MPEMTTLWNDHFVKGEYGRDNIPTAFASQDETPQQNTYQQYHNSAELHNYTPYQTAGMVSIPQQPQQFNGGYYNYEYQNNFPSPYQTVNRRGTGVGHIIHA